MAADVEKLRLATKAGLTITQATQLSGADLAQRALLNATGVTLGPGIDGATLMKSHGGPA